MRPDSLAVIGLGPTGGSIAWSAVRAGVPRVIGHARERGDAVQALKAGAVHELADGAEDAARGADLVVIALPGGGGDLLAKLAPHVPSASFITNLVDVARPVADAASAAGLTTQWASSHLLQGVPGEGFAAARPDPFRGVVVYVSPARTEGDGAAREVMHFWDDVLGAEPVRVAPADHDQRIGWMEQLPRLLAAAVTEAYGANGLGPTTWGREARGMTDLVAGDPAAVARDLISNREAVQAALGATTGALAILGAAIAAGDQRRVVLLLEEARRIRRGSDR